MDGVDNNFNLGGDYSVFHLINVKSPPSSFCKIQDVLYSFKVSLKLCMREKCSSRFNLLTVCAVTAVPVFSDSELIHRFSFLKIRVSLIS